MGDSFPLCALVAAAVVVCAVCATVAAQPPATGEDTGAITVTCEVFCSESELRTAAARISWNVEPGPAAAAGFAMSELAAGEQRLETTVFKDGFDKDLFASFPTVETGSAMVGPAAAAPGEVDRMRAYELRIVSVEQPAGLAALAEGRQSRTTSVVEGLEPGMNYTWRLVIDAGEGRMVSKTVTCQAPVCPADMLEAGP